ncbi:hypothetical protein LMG24238_06703 [Paraburkholderia sediminicola]|uniref:Uncharacterized protein n=1 Tax=Paraburkholderia sediminicola TaxID=458836 RepID=A0A6J5CMM5_9BURK|nr:hypothetical protein LMG24238_06703 [Paraburkholderia sediminicola]
MNHVPGSVYIGHRCAELGVADNSAIERTELNTASDQPRSCGRCTDPNYHDVRWDNSSTGKSDTTNRFLPFKTFDSGGQMQLHVVSRVQSRNNLPNNLAQCALKWSWSRLKNYYISSGRLGRGRDLRPYEPCADYNNALSWGNVLAQRFGVVQGA